MSRVIAVMGTGSIGMRHLRTLRTLGASPLAIPVRQARRAELETGGWATAADLTEAAALGARGVIVATDTIRHFGDTMAALGSGLPVLCEKPMAETSIQAQKLADCSSSTGVPLFVGCCLRFDRGLQRFRERLPEVGDIHSVRAECRSYLPDWRPARDYRHTYAAAAPRHGLLLDLIHEIDHTTWCFGLPAAVSGVLGPTKTLKIAAAETAEAFWQTSGVLVSVGLDYVTRQAVRYIRASGTSGELAYDFIARRVTFAGPDGSRRDESISGSRDDMYTEQMSAFLGVVEGADSLPMATARDGADALRVCEAWARSADAGRMEPVQ